MIRRAALFAGLLSACLAGMVRAETPYHERLPDFGDAADSHNADPANEAIPVNAPQSLVLLGRPIHLTQGASRSAHAMLDLFDDGEPVDFNGLRVLELGSGTGLAGMGAVLRGARVDFTDQSIVMEILRGNVTANLTPVELSRARFFELQWHADHAGHPLRATRYDHIIAADVVYARESMQPLVETLLTFSHDSTRIYLAYVQRFPWAREFFERMDRHFRRHLLRVQDGVWLFRFERR